MMILQNTRVLHNAYQDTISADPSSSTLVNITCSLVGKGTFTPPLFARDSAKKEIVRIMHISYHMSKTTAQQHVPRTLPASVLIIFLNIIIRDERIYRRLVHGMIMVVVFHDVPPIGKGCRRGRV